MKLIKIYLIVVTTLLVSAIGLGIYVWYTIQKLNTAIDAAPTSDMVVPQSNESTDTLNTVPEKQPTEPIVVETDKLTPAQQSILQGFGYTKETFTITPAMITCAENAVGKVRLQEILDGSAPSPLESLKLLPCFKA